ncbi:hypothetical protein DFH06DRAFT_418520 [Mycena polygramma]|nr:hypothetical protein DFH06DRAFT_418520 [Mycena polygramma]
MRYLGKSSLWEIAAKPNPRRRAQSPPRNPPRPRSRSKIPRTISSTMCQTQIQLETPQTPATQSEAVAASRAKTQNSSEKVKKPKGKKKVVEQDVESPDPEAVNEFWKAITKKLPIAPMTTPPETQLATDNRAEPPATKRTKALASGSVGPKQTGATGSNTPCPVCEMSPFHLRYRCPVFLAGSDRIRQRIAELQQDDKADHSKLIQELGGLAEKHEKTTKHKDPHNVNAHSQHLRADARERGVSDQPVDIPGRKVAAASGTRPDASDSDSSGDDSAPSRKKAPPRPVNSYVDAELEAIIRGPLPSRLTVDDLLFDEEEEEEPAESVVLENDDDDIDFRRRSRRLELVASSGEEDEEDEEIFSTGEGAKPKIHPPAVINISVRPNSRHSAPRSPTAPLTTIDARQSLDFDSVGDIAVGEAMASDSIMFDLDTSDNPGRGAANTENVVDAPNHSARSTPIPVTPTRTPKLGGKTSSGVAHPTPVELPELLNDPSTAALQAEDDPIQAADDFPPTPVQPNKVTQPGTPSTPRMVQRMKDRNGKIPVKLSQLDPPFSLSPQVQTQPPEGAQRDAAVEPAVVRKTTRSLSRLASAPPVPSEQPAKRRRAPNKTPEQRAEEEAAKLAAREERERLRKEKAQAKTAGKNPGKRGQETENCPATDPAQTTPSPSAVVDGLMELSVPPPSRTPMSQDEWTVLKPSSPTSPHYRDGESMRDELRSSSPSNSGAQEEAPLFLPAESQVPFPYSQWNSVPQFHAGSPKDSEDEEEEEKVAASMKSSVGGRPTSYRRLTDIASQPSLFSTPTLRAAEFPPATFPSVKDKRAMLYGSLPQEDDDSSDSNSSAGEAPSHIPKSRRAGMATRQR